MKHPARKPELEVPKRRRYEPEKDPGKVVADVKTVFSALRRQSYLPDSHEFWRLGYERLSMAMSHIGYREMAEASGIPPEPGYLESSTHINDEIYRLFISPQWDVPDDEEPAIKLPDYSQIQKEHPDVFEALMRHGGMAAIFPPDSHFYPVDPEYYASDENLKIEMEMWMRRFRSKLMPTFSKLEKENELIRDALLLRGGYLETAERLQLPASQTYLRDPRNLWLELHLVLIHQARRNREPAKGPDFPDIYVDRMLDENEIREARRPDLHRAINALGGYFAAAKAMDLWIPARFWEGNPSLKGEMRNAAIRLNHPGVLPTSDELEEIGRKDLAKSIQQNGGYRKTGSLCGLKLLKATRKSEVPIPAKRACGFLPYPFRRFKPETLKLEGWSVSLELPATARTGVGQVEEYGVWLSPLQSELPVTTGRIGWVHRRPGYKDLWLFRPEGDSRWRGVFQELDIESAIGVLIAETSPSASLPSRSWPGRRL